MSYRPLRGNRGLFQKLQTDPLRRVQLQVQRQILPRVRARAAAARRDLTRARARRSRAS